MDIIELLDDLIRLLKEGRDDGDCIKEIFQNATDYGNPRRKNNPVDTCPSTTYKGYYYYDPMDKFAKDISHNIDAEKLASFLNERFTNKSKRTMIGLLEGEDLPDEILPSDFSSFDMDNISLITARLFEYLIDEMANQRIRIREINRNRKKEIKAEIDELGLLKEFNFQCPVCKKSLYGKNGHKPYRIVNLYTKELAERNNGLFDTVVPPKSLTGMNNKVPMCLYHAEKYSKLPSLEVYNAIIISKEKQKELSVIRDSLHELSMEPEINNLLESVAKVTESTKLKEYDLTSAPVPLSEKIDDIALLHSEEPYVRYYYNYIAQTLSDLDVSKSVSDAIATEIRASYCKFAYSGQDQSVIISELAEWVLEKAEWELSEKNKHYAEIIVAFYIQNCQVLGK